MILDHQYFQLPDDPGTKIWRYLNFTRYVALLESRALYFARADRFDDPFEGTVPDRARSHIAEFFRTIDSQPEELADEFLRLTDQTRLFTFINCWHINPSESDAMWRLYSFAAEGVALQSTVGRLREELSAAPDKVLLGAVRYVNFDEINPSVFFNGISPYIFKRESYEHERELRAVIWMDTPDSATATEEGVRLNPPSVIGKNVEVDLGTLVEKIIVSPSAPNWFGELVRSVTVRYGLTNDIVTSRLYEPPSRRLPRIDSNVDKSFSITRGVLEYLHSQHLEYTELQIREQERLAQRQADAITEWLQEIERDIAAVEFCDAEGTEVKGRQAFFRFASEIPQLSIVAILSHQVFNALYFISGRIDNVYREISRSVLSDGEKDLFLRKMIFLYTETIAKPQITLMGKINSESLDPMSVPESCRPMIAHLMSQVTRYNELMTKKGI